MQKWEWEWQKNKKDRGKGGLQLPGGMQYLVKIGRATTKVDVYLVSAELHRPHELPVC